VAKLSAGSIKPKLYKSIFQARYKPRLEFYDLMVPASKKFEEFPHWQTDGLKLTLFDPGKHCSIGIAFDSFSFSQDMASIDQEKSFVDRIVDTLPAALEVTSFLRFGLRRWYLAALDMPFSSLVSVLDLKLFSQHERLREILPEKVDDLMYVTVNSESPYTARVTVGPVHDFEIPSYVPLDQEHHLDPQKRAEQYIEIIKKYPKVALYVEIDYSRSAENLTVDDAKSFAKRADERTSTIINDLTNYFLSAKVEE
jgi:hypothetical protein